MITQETIDKILSTARIEEVVSDFVKLKKRGVNYLGNCPFHNEKTPSFTVSPTKEIYKCFGCGKAGNTVSFLMEHEKITYPEALRYLADKYKIEIEETVSSPAAQEERTERESLYIVLEAAQKYYANNLLHTEEGQAIGLSYFKERGISDGIIKSFGLGWSSPGWDTFSQWALKNSYNKDYLIKTGLSIETNDGRIVDRFRERVLFPIHNISGKVLGFGGRILKSSGKEAKYINSPETEIYNKSRILYGISQAKKAIRQKDSCVLVEGYMDVLSLYQRGLENVVASSGTSLTEDQLKLVKRFTDNIIFLFDGDEAGQKAALRGVDLALEQGLNVKVVVLPAEHDPDSFAKENELEEIERFLEENSQNFIGFKSKLLLKGAKNDPDKRSKAIREIISSLALIPDQISRSLYIKEAEKALDVDEKLLYEELRRFLLSKLKEENKSTTEINISTPATEPQKDITVSLKSTLSQERQVIKNLLIYGDKPFSEASSVAAYMLSELADVEWENASCKKLMEVVKQALERQPEGLDFSYFVNVEDPELQKFVSDLVIEAHRLDEGWKKFLQRPVVAPLDNYIEEVTSALNHLKLRLVLRLIKENSQELKKSTNNIDETTNLIAVQKHLIEMKMQLSKSMGIVIVE